MTGVKALHRIRMKNARSNPSLHKPLKPGLEYHGVIHCICLVHRGIFFFEVVRQSRQATQ